MAKVEVQVPRLTDLFDWGYISIVKEIYLKLKPSLQERYSCVKNIDDEKMAIYISYYMFCKDAIDQSFDKYADRLEKCTTEEEIEAENYKYYSEVADDWCDILEEYDTKTEMIANLEYKTAAEELKRGFQETKEIDKYIKANYNENIEKAVRNYFFNNRLDLSKIGIDDSDENIYRNALICAYHMIKEIMNDKHKNDFFKKIIIKNEITSLSYEQSKVLVDELLGKLQDVMLTEDEYMENYRHKVKVAHMIINITNSEIEDFNQKYPQRKLTY